tara:strand:+ start:1553 stop:2179 length:627 start_codon:yes stop_codon:yes gene_type:complete
MGLGMVTYALRFPGDRLLWALPNLKYQHRMEGAGQACDGKILPCQPKQTHLAEPLWGICLGMFMQKDIGEVGPQQAWEILSNDPTARLVDVRTRAEWSFVGVPDLAPLSGQTLLVEWKSFPQMQRNENFVSELLTGLDDAPASKLLFICRSGARSLEAARLVASALGGQDNPPECINVAEGFEGDLDPAAHRGQSNGWKAAGLPWRQS